MENGYSCIRTERPIETGKKRTETMTTDDNEPIVITGAARTPMGGFQGELAALSAPE